MAINPRWLCSTFNRTAYGIEICSKCHKAVHVELTFNRTAYGIEIEKRTIERTSSCLLIAPLMELKFDCIEWEHRSGRAFNRTAYGIEICMKNFILLNQALLIAPLMELKFHSEETKRRRAELLIAPLMELKY